MNINSPLIKDVLFEQFLNLIENDPLFYIQQVLINRQLPQKTVDSISKTIQDYSTHQKESLLEQFKLQILHHQQMEDYQASQLDETSDKEEMQEALEINTQKKLI